MRISLAAFAVACLSAGAAEAQTTATFSYVDTADNIDLTGQVLGTLSGDYFTVLGVSNLTYDGQAVAFTPMYDGSLDTFAGLGGGHNGDGTAVVTVDGSYMDWIVYSNGNGFLFADGDNVAQEDGEPVYQSGASFGETGAVYNPADWTLDVAVPEPASLALFGLGFGAVVLGRRRRRLT